MQLETKKASLDTLSVTIQALHVSGKQMTLAVFKQLPEAGPYDCNGNLSEMNFWGVVRYSIKDSGDIWAVASKDGLLYRCDIRSRIYFNYTSAQKEVSQIIHCINWWNSYDAQKHQYVSPPEHPFSHQNIKWTEDGLISLQNDLLEAKERLFACQQSEASSAALCRLPQLFIAV